MTYRGAQMHTTQEVVTFRWPLTVGGSTFGATVSAGLATSGDVGHIVEALLAAADLTLYQAKRAGRNRVESRLHAECLPQPVIALAA